MKGNKTYSVKNQERLRAYLRKIESDDTKTSDRHDTTARGISRNDSNDIQRRGNGSPRDRGR